MRCKKCGTELRSDDEFCYRCGERTGPLQRLFASRAIVGSSIAIFIVLVAIILTFLLVSGRLNLGAITSKIHTSTTNRSEKLSKTPDSSVSPTAIKPSDSASPKKQETSDSPSAITAFVPKDVTKSEKKAMKTLTEKMKPFLGYSASFYENGSHRFKWDNVSATTMAMYNAYFVDRSIQYGTKYKTVEKTVKKEMKALFGDNAKYDFTYGGYFPDYVFVKTNDTIVYNAVRVVGKSPSMKIDHIINYKENRYRVIVRACLVSDTNPDNKGYEQAYTVYVDKDETSECGYVIRKIKLYKKKDKDIA